MVWGNGTKEKKTDVDGRKEEERSGAWAFFGRGVGVGVEEARSFRSWAGWAGRRCVSWEGKGKGKERERKGKMKGKCQWK